MESYFLINLIEESQLQAKKDETFFWDDINTLFQLANQTKDLFNTSEFWHITKNFLQANTILIYIEEPDHSLKFYKTTSSISFNPPLTISKEDSIYFKTPMQWKKNRINFSNIQTNFYDSLSESYAQIFNFYIENIGCFFVLYENIAIINANEKMNFVLNLLQLAQKQPSPESNNSTIEKKIIENSKNSYIILDEHRRLVDLNQAALQFLGYRNKFDILNKKFTDFFITNITSIEDHFYLVKNGENKKNLTNVRITLRDGRILPIELTIIPHFNQFNKFSNYIILINDLSTIEAFQQQAQDMAQKAKVGSAIATFSHEVKNSLNNLTQLNNELFIYDELEEFFPHFEKMKKHINKFSVYMERILNETKSKNYNKRSLDMVALIKNEIKEKSDKLNINDIKVIEQYANSTQPAYADETAMHEVFNNLIINAIDAMSQPNIDFRQLTISITSDSHTEMVLVDITDTGTGIPKKYQDKILNQSFTTKDNGNGIGLTHSAKIIKEHQGKISFTSIPGSTKFHVELPKY
jgi:two-component system sporulation sensor kinase A